MDERFVKLFRRFICLGAGLIIFLIAISLLGDWGLLVGVMSAYILYDFAK